VPVCLRCGRENPAESRFCNGCGAELAPAPAVAVEELKVVTILFADITGSTALGERLDAEGLKEVMGAFFAAMRVEIEAEGGTVEKFIGDAVMAAFGVPRVHEDDPARALRAALRMRSRLKDLNELLDERYGVTLELRMGINTGSVLAVVEPRPGEALATGDAVNAAARLEQAAEPGQVLVAQRTAQAARHFRFGAPRALELRGKAEPLLAVALVNDQPITEGTLSGTRAPLVGRQRELELLTATYRRAVEEGRPHLVTLYGEAGVGKSRLVGELLAGLQAGGPAPQVARGRCLAYGEGISYWPLAEVLKAHAHALDTDSADYARDRVHAAAEATLRTAGADTPGEIATVLTASIGLAQADTQHGALELRAETQLAWRSFFSALAAKAPTVVVVEDVQWADAAVLELLEDVADHAAGPLFLLCTARPELTAKRPTWGGGRRSFTGLAVEPLAPEETARLAELLLEPGTDADARAAIIARAEGNPFFLEEIVRARGDGPARAKGLPDTVQAALAARVDLLPPDEKRVLQTAAVVGRVFWPRAVAEIADLELATVGELLDRLQNRDLILSRLSSSMSGQRELIFKHALICEVAYESVPRRDRVRRHGAVADWIERTYAGRLAEVLELIAHHRLAAHRLAPSQPLARAAFHALADAAEGAYARAGFERALTLSREAAELAPSPLDRARVLETHGHAAFVTFDGSTAWASLREAADIVTRETPDDHARIAHICGSAVMIPVRAQGMMRTEPTDADVRPYLELGLDAAGDRDSEGLVLLLAALAYWEFGFGIDPNDLAGDKGRRAGEDAREIARRLERRDLEMMALDALSAGMNIRGRYGHADTYDRERIAIARTARDPFEVGDAFYTAAWSALEVGRYAEVLALADEYEATAPKVLPLGHLALAVMARLPLGEWDEAIATFARMRELLAGESPPSFASGGHGAAALIHEMRGERGASDALLAEIDAWDVTGRRLRRWPIPPAAVALARRGDHVGARRLLALLDPNGVERARALEARCSVIAEAQAWDEAAVVVAEARALAESGGLLALTRHADRLEGRARLVAGDAAGALASLERAHDGFSDLGAAWEVAVTELALGAALLALDRDATGPLTRAAETFERLRVRRELERARSLLGAGPAARRR
jgi:class 3 adenylate cyclase